MDLSNNFVKFYFFVRFKFVIPIRKQIEAKIKIPPKISAYLIFSE